MQHPRALSLRIQVTCLLLVALVAVALLPLWRDGGWSGWLFAAMIAGAALWRLLLVLKPYDAVPQQLEGMLAGRRGTDAARGSSRPTAPRSLPDLLTDARLELHELRGESERYRQQYRTLLERMPLAVLSLDAQQRIVYANPQFEALTGRIGADLYQQHWSQLLVPEDRSLMALYWQDLLARGSGHQSIRLQRRDAVACWAEVRLCMLESPRGEPGYLVILRDLSVQKQALDLLHLERRKATAVLENVAEAVLLADENDCLLYVNQSAQRLLAQPAERLIGQPLARVLPLRANANANADAISTRAGGIPSDGFAEYQLENEGGRQLPVRLRMISVRDEEARAGYRIYLLRPLRTSPDPGPDRQVRQDALTGLPNAVLFETRLGDALAKLRLESSPSVVALVDLDHFRQLNEESGRHVGDDALRQVARVLARNLRQGDLVARLGGDEFGLLLSGCDSIQALPLIEAIRADLECFGFEHGGRAYQITASIGVTELRLEDQTLDEVLQRADEGCARAKTQGRNLVNLVSLMSGRSFGAAVRETAVDS